MGLGRGAANSGPRNVTELGNVLWSISSQGILAQTKIDILQAVAKCPKVSISSKWVKISSLLDSGSEVSLICQSYFEEHLLPKIETPTGENADAHILFNITVANDGQLPMKTYIELDINFLGLKVLNVGSSLWRNLTESWKETSDKTSRHHSLEFDMACIPSLY